MRTGFLSVRTVWKFTDFPHRASCKYCLWFYSNLFWVCSSFVLNSQSNSLKLTMLTNMAKKSHNSARLFIYFAWKLSQNSWKCLLSFRICPSNQLVPITNVTCPHNRCNLISIPGASNRQKKELRQWVWFSRKAAIKFKSTQLMFLFTCKCKAYHSCLLINILK